MSKALAVLGLAIVLVLAFGAYIWFTVPDPRVPPEFDLPDEAEVQLATTTNG